MLAETKCDVKVGALAQRDPILARASLLAADVMLAMAKAPERRRVTVMSRELSKIGSGLPQQVGTELGRQLRRGRATDQALFDSMRVAIADRLLGRGLEELKLQAAQRYGWDVVLDSGLGDETARQAGCIATGATTAIVGTILGVYTGGAGASLAATGGQLVGGALDCNRGQRELQAQQAQLEAQRAAAALAQAETLARQQQAASSRRKQLLIAGGGMLGVVALAAFILR